jgi:cytochrome c biogenesis protein CcmG/thiol:disulfide interchange protein DsbE
LNLLRKRIGTVLLLAALLLSTCGCANAGPRAPQGLPKVGAPAPDFQLRTPAGESYRLSGLRGQAVFLNFWAVNCPYCKGEMRAIQSIHTRYREQGLAVLGINKGDRLLNVADFANELQLTFPLLLDRNGKVSGAYGAVSLPTSFFIDRAGVIRGIHMGEMFEDDMAAQVQAVLAEEPLE